MKREEPFIVIDAAKNTDQSRMRCVNATITVEFPVWIKWPNGKPFDAQDAEQWILDELRTADIAKAINKVGIEVDVEVL